MMRSAALCLMISDLEQEELEHTPLLLVGCQLGVAP